LYDILSTAICQYFTQYCSWKAQAVASLTDEKFQKKKSLQYIGGSVTAATLSKELGGGDKEYSIGTADYGLDMAIR